MNHKVQVVVGVVFALLIFSAMGCSGQPERHYDLNVQCRSPNGLRETKTINRWKFERIVLAIRRVLPKGETGIAFSDLAEKVTADIPEEEHVAFGNLKWHIETVVLELETTGELTRFPDSETALPQNVRR